MAFAAVFLRPYVVKERVFSQELSDKELKQQTRLTRYQYNLLLDSISDQLESGSESELTVAPDTKLLAVLEFLATGQWQWSVSQKYGISQASLCKYIGQVVEAIITLQRQCIHMPMTEEAMRETADRFEEVFGFPDLLGCVDGTLIPMQTPVHGEAVFVNRKGQHSITCQIICDADMRILDVVARWPGSVHDSFVFRNSGICQRFENNFYGHYKLIGDRGYRLTSYMLTIYRTPRTAVQVMFNDLLCQTRCAVERCIGLLKGRWRCLHRTGGELLYSPEKTCRIFLACSILHNICFLTEGDELLEPDEDFIEEEGDVNQVDAGNGGRAAQQHRNAFVAGHAIFHP